MRTTTAAGLSPELRKRYLQKLRTSLRLLKPAAERLSREAANPGDFDMLERESHRLSGTGATYGFPAISSSAFALEHAVRDGLRDVTKVSALLSALLKAVLSAITASKSEEAAAAASQETQFAGYHPLVCVVGEDAYLCQRLVKLLKPFARLAYYASADAVLHAAQRQRFDLIILDFAPESQAGREIQAGLDANREQASAPVVWLTSKREQPRAKLSASAGIRDHIEKPFASEKLVERVMAILSVHKPVVLVADDDPFVRGIFTSKLRQRGVDVSVASCGPEALELARRLRPHAIILDRMMPDLDGMQVLASIRNSARLRDTPVLILSARRAEADVVEGLARGADDYVCKPFLPDTVVDRCMGMLRNNKKLAA